MAYGHTDGHEKEPKSFFGGKHDGGGHRPMPLAHSHSLRPKRRIKGTHHRHVGKHVGMKVQGKSR